MAETEARRASDEKCAVFGLFYEANLVGMAGIAREAMAKLAHKAGIWGVYVSPSHCGQGAGKTLLVEALKFASNLPGVRQVNLYVNATNANAIALYESLGFVTFGREQAGLIIDGVAYDELLMTRVLSASPNVASYEDGDTQSPRRPRAA